MHSIYHKHLAIDQIDGVRVGIDAGAFDAVPKVKPTTESNIIKWNLKNGLLIFDIPHSIDIRYWKSAPNICNFYE